MMDKITRAFPGKSNAGLRAKIRKLCASGMTMDGVVAAIEASVALTAMGRASLRQLVEDHNG
jgi:hypothetical protein